MKDLLTIPELAEATGKKKQGLYEQTKNKASKLYPYLVFQGSKAYVRSEALTELYGIDQGETPKSQESQVRSQESKAISQDSQGKSQVSQDDSQGASQESQVPEGEPSQESQESQAEDQGKSQGESQGEPQQGQDMIAFLQEMLREKDKQIAQLTQLLDQEQQLHARTNLLLAEYQKKEAEEEQGDHPEEPETGGEATAAQPEQSQEPQKKHGWLYRFFFGED